jgi:DNA polymerase-3 subunit delta'
MYFYNMQFKSIIGHQELKANLITQVKNNRISHAQMFLGHEGSGNFQLALAFAQYVNCVDKTEEDSCGICNNCKKYTSLQHPDLNFVFPTAISALVTEKPDSKKYYKEWREFLLENQYFDLDAWCNFIDIDKRQPIINKQDSELINGALTLKSFESEYKVVLIWWPEKMNIECANKILKTLEEPADKSLLLMVGHQVEELLPTIISRVQITKVQDLQEEEIAAALAEEGQLDEENSSSIARLAEGNYFQALNLAKNPDKDEQLIEQFQKWMRLCYKLEIPALNNWVEETGRNGREQQKNFLLYCLRMFRNCTVRNYGDESLARLHHKEEGFVKNFSKFIHAGNIVDFSKEFNDAYDAISRNGNGKIIFMSLSLKVCNFLRYKP